MADIDIEAANKIRVAMGLKPLPVPNATSDGPVFKSGTNGDTVEDARSTLETRSAAAEENWLKAQGEADAKADRQKRKEAAKKAREAAEREKKLVGVGLADLDDGLDTKSWLRQQKKRQRAIEDAQMQEEERVKKQRLADYTARDLAGVRVGHELQEFAVGDEQILTLKDQEIGGEESEDDELENLGLREKERLDERLELKKKKPIYNPLEDDGSGEKSILAHYDEEIDGKKKSRFTLDGSGSTVERQRQSEEDSAVKSKGIFVSLDILDDLKLPTSDYIDVSEIKVKKPKKSKKSKTTRKRITEDEDMFANDEAPVVPAKSEDTLGSSLNANGSRQRKQETNFVDDDDLQVALAQQRKAALKKRQNMRPEEIAKQLRDEEANGMDGVENQEEEPAGLVLDETSEFVTHLNLQDDEEIRRTSRKREKSGEATVKVDIADDRASPDNAQSPVEDDSMEIDSYAAIAEKAGEVAKEGQGISATGLVEEKTLGTGLGATLALLRERGQLKETDAHDANVKFRTQQQFRADKLKREEDFEKKARQQRERDRASGKFAHMSRQQQDDYARQSNNQREAVESREVANMFNREYKPTFKIEHVDEFGRVMNEKEAFKFLSHKFHGKTSGKMKHEKRLKKIEEEKKRLAAGALDTSAAGQSMSGAMGDKAKKNKQAGIRLQ